MPIKATQMTEEEYTAIGASGVWNEESTVGINELILNSKELVGRIAIEIFGDTATLQQFSAISFAVSNGLAAGIALAGAYPEKAQELFANVFGPFGANRAQVVEAYLFPLQNILNGEWNSLDSIMEDLRSTLSPELVELMDKALEKKDE